jgi:hypothetical protein
MIGFRLYYCFSLLCFAVGEQDSRVRRLRKHKSTGIRRLSQKNTDAALRLLEEQDLQSKENTSGENDSQNEIQLCLETMRQVAVNDKLSHREYVKFLFDLSGGDVDVRNFTSLSPSFKAVFDASACPADTECAVDHPFVSLKSGQKSEQLQQLLCVGAMSEIRTEVSVSFEYTIRYNSVLISDEKVIVCLENGSENFLRDGFGCEQVVPKRQRKLSSASAPKSDLNLDSDFRRMLDEEGFRDLQLSMDTGTDSCRYNADVVIDMLTTFDCDPPTVDPDFECLLVRSTATVSAPAMDEPSESELRTEVTMMLRNGINGDQIGAFLPSDCVLA